MWPKRWRNGGNHSATEQEGCSERTGKGSGYASHRHQLLCIKGEPIACMARYVRTLAPPRDHIATTESKVKRKIQAEAKGFLSS